MILFSLPYLSFLVVLGILAIIYSKSEKSQQGINVGCYLLFLLFFGLRGYIWHDWTSYLTIFETMDTSNLSIMLADVDSDYSFYILMGVCKKLWNSYGFFTLICTAINTTLLFNFCLKNKFNTPLFLAIFLCIGGYEIMINLMRNSIAILIFLNSIHYIIEKKPLPYCLLCLLAITFHFSAILFLPLYFINTQIPRWGWLSIFGISIILYFSNVPWANLCLQCFHIDNDLINGRISLYSQYYTSQGHISLGFLERLITGITVLVLYPQLINQSPNGKVFVNILLLYLVSTFVFNDLLAFNQRICLLLAIGYWGTWHEITVVLNKNKSKFYLYWICFICVYGLYHVMKSTNTEVYKYENRLFGITDPETKRDMFITNFMDSDDANEP